MSKDDALSLQVGDMVSISGRIVTGRDKLHRFLVDERPSKKEMPVDLNGTILYHCGPVVRKTSKGFEIVACLARQPVCVSICMSRQSSRNMDLEA